MVAGKIAEILKAEKLVSMTDIAGLLRDKDDETTLIPEVEVSEIEGYKSAGIIAGGMIPKIEGCLQAINRGVSEVHLIDGDVKYVRAPLGDNAPLSMWSNRWSTMPVHGVPEELLKPRPDARAFLARAADWNDARAHALVAQLVIARLLAAHMTWYVEWPHVDGRFVQVFLTLPGYTQGAP